VCVRVRVNSWFGQSRLRFVKKDLREAGHKCRETVLCGQGVSASLWSCCFVEGELSCKLLTIRLRKSTVCIYFIIDVLIDVFIYVVTQRYQYIHT